MTQKFTTQVVHERLEKGLRVLDPAADLNPSLRTLHPTLYTVHPTPYPLSPKLCSLHPPPWQVCTQSAEDALHALELCPEREPPRGFCAFGQHGDLWLDLGFEI
jgi:hypothetical protein